MATSFTPLLVAVASLATVCCVVVTSGNAREDATGAAAPVPAELVQWHSGLSVTGDSLVKPEWKSTLTAIVPEDSTALLAMHRAVGIRDVADDGFNFSPKSFDAPKGGHKSERNPARKQEGSGQRAR